MAAVDYELMLPIGGDWYELLRKHSTSEPRVFVKVGFDGGRAFVGRMVMDGERIDTSTMREIPVSRIEAMANHPDFLDAHLKAQQDDSRFMAPAAVARLDHALTDLLTATAGGSPGARFPRPNRRRRSPLTRPDGTDPDGFARRVAEAYNEAILKTKAPAPVLAEEAGVPVVTVHRWIAEARRRGHLPPARKGRAG